MPPTLSKISNTKNSTATIIEVDLGYWMDTRLTESDGTATITGIGYRL